MNTLTILIIDDDEADRREIGRQAKRAFPDSEVRFSEGDCPDSNLMENEPDVVLVDYGLPEMTGIELMEMLCPVWSSAAFVIITGQGDEEIARDSIKRGAIDYISKSKIKPQALDRLVRNAITISGMQARLADQQKELEIFADVMVHDLKSPIRAIRFLVEELEIGLTENNPDEIANVMRLLDKSASRMGSLVDSLACYVTTTKEIAFEQASLISTIETAIAALAPDIAESEAIINLDINDITLCCCPPQLSLLFQNVFGNAIKYSGENKPVIDVTASVIQPDHISLRISDSGVGMPKDFCERAFEPFKRAPGVTSVAGTGLGLATCRKVAMRHGGKIWCDTAVAVGTTIVVDLPVEA